MSKAGGQTPLNANCPADGPESPHGSSSVALGESADARAEFGRWAEGLWPRLVRLAYRHLWNTHDAEEVAQESLTLAWREIERGGGIERGDAWVCRVAINLCLNRLRRAGVRKSSSGEMQGASVADGGLPGETDELTQRLRLAIRDLPDRQQVAIVLRDLEGMSYEQIATILEVREAAARLLVHRAREGVRQMLLNRWPDSFGPG